MAELTPEQIVEIKHLIDNYFDKIIEDNSLKITELESISDESNLLLLASNNDKSVAIPISSITNLVDSPRWRKYVYKKATTEPEIPKPTGVDKFQIPPDNTWFETIDYSDASDGFWWETSTLTTGEGVLSIDGVWTKPKKINLDGTGILREISMYRVAGFMGGATINYVNDSNGIDKLSIELDKNISPGGFWKDTYILEEDKEDGVNYDDVAVYNPTNDEHLWKTSCWIITINGKNYHSTDWSTPIRISVRDGSDGDKGDDAVAPTLKGTILIESSSEVMLCDPITNEALVGQEVELKIKLLNLNEGNINTNTIQFSAEAFDINGNSLYNDINESVKLLNHTNGSIFASLTNGKWQSNYERIRIRAKLEDNDNKLYETYKDIRKLTTAKDGVSGITAMLTLPFQKYQVDENGSAIEESYLDNMPESYYQIYYGGSLVEGGEVIYSFGSVTPGIIARIASGGEWVYSDGRTPDDNPPNGSEGRYEIVHIGQPTQDQYNIKIIGKYKNNSLTQTFVVFKETSGSEGKPGPEGQYFQEIYTLTEEDIVPSIININVESIDFQIENFLPTEGVNGVHVWSFDRPLVNKTYKYRWYARRYKTNGKWGNYKPSVKDYVYQEAGTGEIGPIFKTSIKPAVLSFGINETEWKKVKLEVIYNETYKGIGNIWVGKELDDELTNDYEDDYFEYEILPTTNEVRFRLKSGITFEEKFISGNIPITFEIPDMERNVMEYMSYIITKPAEDGITRTVKLDPSVNTVYKSATAFESTTPSNEENMPQTVIITTHVNNVDLNELTWKYKIDDGNFINVPNSGSFIRKDNSGKITINTTGETMFSDKIEIMVAHNGEHAQYLFDKVIIQMSQYGSNGLPGKTPFTKEWPKSTTTGINRGVHRNNLQYIDYIYYRPADTWHTLKDVPESPDGITLTGDQIPSEPDSRYNTVDDAFEIVIAEQANLAGFVFKDQRLYSQNTFIDLPPNENQEPELPDEWLDPLSEKSLLMLDGVRGIIRAKRADISGKITAKEGEIGGFLIGERMLVAINNGQQTAGLSGLRTDSSNNTLPAFWAGNAYSSFEDYQNIINSGNYPDGIAIYHDGSIYMNNAFIRGEILATGGEIGGWKINSNNSNLESSDGKIGMSPGVGTNDLAFWAGGKTTENPKFSVKHDGTVNMIGATIEGEINATNGTLGNLTIIDKLKLPSPKVDSNKIGTITKEGIDLVYETNSYNSGTGETNQGYIQYLGWKNHVNNSDDIKNYTGVIFSDNVGLKIRANAQGTASNLELTSKHGNLNLNSDNGNINLYARKITGLPGILFSVYFNWGSPNNNNGYISDSINSFWLNGSGKISFDSGSSGTNPAGTNEPWLRFRWGIGTNPDYARYTVIADVAGQNAYARVDKIDSTGIVISFVNLKSRNNNQCTITLIGPGHTGASYG